MEVIDRGATAGIDPDLVFMCCGACAPGSSTAKGFRRNTVSSLTSDSEHSPTRVNAIVDRATKLGCEIVHQDPAEGDARLVDPNGTDWELEDPDLGRADPDNRDGYLDL